MSVNPGSSSTPVSSKHDANQTPSKSTPGRQGVKRKHDDSQNSKKDEDPYITPRKSRKQATPKKVLLSPTGVAFGSSADESPDGGDSQRKSSSDGTPPEVTPSKNYPTGDQSLGKELKSSEQFSESVCGNRDLTNVGRSVQSHLERTPNKSAPSSSSKPSSSRTLRSSGKKQDGRQLWYDQEKTPTKKNKNKKCTTTVTSGSSSRKGCNRDDIGHEDDDDSVGHDHFRNLNEQLMLLCKDSGMLDKGVSPKGKKVKSTKGKKAKGLASSSPTKRLSTPRKVKFPVKQKEKDTKTSDDSETEPPSIMDERPGASIDKVLEDTAARSNLSAKNVKNILHHLITNEHVLEMVKNSLREADEKEEGLKPACYEPKMTRTKVKQIMEKEGNVPHLWPISPLKKASKPQKNFLDLSFLDDEEDEEYDPSKDEQADSDVDSESVVSSQFSDFGSPASSTPMSPATPSRSFSYGDEGQSSQGQGKHVAVMATPMGPPLPPSAKTKQEEAETIARRTRSKLPLEETPLEEIESTFLPPDVTFDMYDVESEDKDWLDFLLGLKKTAVPEPPPEGVAHGDTEDDPEYNFLAEEEEIDVEDYRFDKAVKVSKKELNELMDELIEGYGDMTEDDWEIGDTVTMTTSDRTSREGTTKTAKVIANPTDGDVPTITTEERLQIEDQMRKHVQLLTQVYILSIAQTGYEHISTQSVQYLHELDMFSQRAVTGRVPSAFSAINLRAAIEFAANEHTKPQIQETPKKRRRRRFKPGQSVNLPFTLQDCLANCKALVYTNLLPIDTFLTPGDAAKLKVTFTDAEDNLIALGLDQFGHLMNYRTYLQQYLIPCKTDLQLRTHIKNMRAKKAKDNPIKLLKDRKELPNMPRSVSIVTEVKAPVEQMSNLPEWLSLYKAAIKHGQDVTVEGDSRPVTPSSKTSSPEKSISQTLPMQVTRGSVTSGANSASEQRKTVRGRRKKGKQDQESRKCRAIVPNPSGLEKHQVPSSLPNISPATVITLPIGSDGKVLLSGVPSNFATIVQCVQSGGSVSPRVAMIGNVVPLTPAAVTVISGPDASTGVSTPVVGNVTQETTNSGNVSELGSKTHKCSAIVSLSSSAQEGKLRSSVPIATKGHSKLNDGDSSHTDSVAPVSSHYNSPVDGSQSSPLVAAAVCTTSLSLGTVLSTRDVQSSLVTTTQCGDASVKVSAQDGCISSTIDMSGIGEKSGEKGRSELSRQVRRSLSKQLRSPGGEIASPVEKGLTGNEETLVSDMAETCNDNVYMQQDIETDNSPLVMSGNSPLVTPAKSPLLPSGKTQLVTPEKDGAGQYMVLVSGTDLERTPTKQRPVLPKSDGDSSKKPAVSPFLGRNNKSPRRRRLQQQARAILPKGLVVSGAILSPTKKIASTIAARAHQRTKRKWTRRKPIVPTKPTRKKSVLSPTVKPVDSDAESTGVPSQETDFTSEYDTVDSDVVSDTETPADQSGKLRAEEAMQKSRPRWFNDDAKAESDEDQRTDDLDALMAASSTIRYAPSSKCRDKHLKSKKRKQQLALAMMAPDIIGTDPLRDERDTAFSQAYLSRVQSLVSPESYLSFLKVLSDFTSSTRTPVELYQEIKNLLADFPDLVDDFAAFLLPHQAVECHCLVPNLQFTKARTFLRKVEVYFGKHPNYFRRILKAFTTWQSNPVKTNDQLREAVIPLLRGQQHLIQQFMAIFPQERPPDRSVSDYEELDLSEEETKVQDGYEVIRLPEEENYCATVWCQCECHDTTNTRYLQRKRHCKRCRLKIIGGRIYIQSTDKNMRPAQIVYPEGAPDNMNVSSPEAADDFNNDSDPEVIEAFEKDSNHLTYQISSDQHIGSGQFVSLDQVATESPVDNLGSKKVTKSAESEMVLGVVGRLSENKSITTLSAANLSPVVSSELGTLDVLELQETPGDEVLNLNGEKMRQHVTDVQSEKCSGSNGFDLPLQSIEEGKDPSPGECRSQLHDEIGGALYSSNSQNALLEFPWTRSEDKIILEQCKQNGSSFDTFQTIAASLEQRTTQQVSDRFQSLMNMFSEDEDTSESGSESESKGFELPVPPTGEGKDSSASSRSSRQSQLHEKIGADLYSSDSQCALLEFPWTRDEDKIILEQCKENGASFDTFQTIAASLGQRTTQQVSDRFQSLMKLFSEDEDSSDSETESTTNQ